jgi:hypothetical protein
MDQQPTTSNDLDSNGNKLAPSSQTATECQHPPTAQCSQTTTFTCFPKLVPELRIRIWELACFTTRIVELHITPTGIDEENAETLEADYDGPSPAYRILTRIPPLLAVCKESHQLLSKYYAKPLGHPKDAKQKLVRFNDSTTEIELFGRIDINWVSDIILLPPVNYFQARGVPKKIISMLVTLIAKSSEKKLRLALEIAEPSITVYHCDKWSAWIEYGLGSSFLTKHKFAHHIELFLVPVDNNWKHICRYLRLGNGAEELFYFSALTIGSRINQVYFHIAKSLAVIKSIRGGASNRIGYNITFERQENPKRPTISISGLEIALPRESIPGEEGLAAENEQMI